MTKVIDIAFKQTQSLNKIASMVPVLQSLSQEKANVDDVAQVFESITNTIANIFTVNFGFQSFIFSLFSNLIIL